VDPDAVEIRVLGCLIEKQRTTPDAYPLSLNSLRLACNQTTNREPVVVYEEREIKAALERLSDRGWARFASGAGSRALKYRHLFDEALSLSEAEISLLAVLMLRGPQTAGELKQRSERLHRLDSTAELTQVLEELARRELVMELDRRPGQKEERWAQLLGGETDTAPTAKAASTSVPAADDRLGAIEDRLERLESMFEELQARLEP
jgi:uncharacterized protein